MKDDTFRSNIEQLGKNFGVRGQMLNDRLEILWNEFSAVPDPVFVRACEVFGPGALIVSPSNSLPGGFCRLKADLVHFEPSLRTPQAAGKRRSLILS